MGYVKAVVGTQYGDEGKGKIVDQLAKDADYVVRFQGGNNAGHTIVIDGEEHILHFIPAGIFQGKTCVIGNGAVLDLDKLKEEVIGLEQRGVSVLENLLISENAHLILPSHVEESKTDKIGGTGRGIAPAYTSKSNKTGLRVRDIINVQCPIDQVDLDARPNLTLFRDYLLKHSYLMPNIVNVAKMLNFEIDMEKNILIEGAQATGLDIDHGEYPFVTSSNCSAGGICTGTGIGPTRITDIIGVAKAYITRVDRDGSGPLVTQLDGWHGEFIRKQGNEYGATTKRPRRVGWFDAVLTRHSAMINDLDELIITKLDILDGLDELKICTAYELDGEIIYDYPSDGIVLRQCSPVYETMPGWKGSVKGIRSSRDLPIEAVRYVKRIEDLVNVPITMVTNGRDRKDYIIFD